MADKKYLPCTACTKLLPVEREKSEQIHKFIIGIKGQRVKLSLVDMERHGDILGMGSRMLTETRARDGHHAVNRLFYCA